MTTTASEAIGWERVGDHSDILYDKADGIAKITMNRPEVLNAFRPQTLHQMQWAFEDAHMDASVGVVLLTASLVSGWLYHDDLLAQHLLHKTVLSGAAWVFFSGLLVGRKLLGWRGRTVLQMVLAGVVLLALAYFGSKVALELILERV